MRYGVTTASSNRTIVGLKRGKVGATVDNKRGSNRTIVGLKPGIAELDELLSRSNRTIVGLKQGDCMCKVSHHLSSNRTIVGLKLCLRQCPNPASPCSNRTIVGLKPLCALPATLLDPAAIAPLWD